LLETERPPLGGLSEIRSGVLDQAARAEAFFRFLRHQARKPPLANTKEDPKQPFFDVMGLLTQYNNTATSLILKNVASTTMKVEH